MAVPFDDVARHWNLMLSFLQPAVERSHGRWTAEAVFEMIESGRLQAWVIIDGPLLLGVGLTEIQVYPTCKVLVCAWLGGVQMHLWLELLDRTVSEWAIRQGCSLMEMRGRRGWERVGAKIGFKPGDVFFEKELYATAGEDDAAGANDQSDGAAAVAAGGVAGSLSASAERASPAG